MQFPCLSILKVIFVLSTIVAVTDCCSSRILLLREHTLQMEEHVVQFVNQLELQQQQELNAAAQSNEMDLFSDPTQILKMFPDLNIEAKLATLVTTERESSTSWSPDEETTTTTSTTTNTAIPITTITMATGEPPPEDTTLRISTDATIRGIDEAVSPTTKTTTTSTPITNTDTSTPKVLDDVNFKLPCSSEYTSYFCLNGGNCYRWDKLIYCECAVGYGGERCDYKTEDGVYAHSRPTASEPRLKMAHMFFSFPMLIVLSTIYVIFGAIFMFRNASAQRQKQQQPHLDKQRFFVSC